MNAVQHEDEQVAAPFFKFVGGKRQLLPAILTRVPKVIDTYYEPFAGGAAVFFALFGEGRFRKAVIGDFNRNLVNAYVQVRDNCAAVIRHLRTHEQRHSDQRHAEDSEDYYYAQRQLSLQDGPAGAARLLFMLRACYNGLYRENHAGEFNAPWGKNPAVNVVHADKLRAASRALQDVKIVHSDFEKLVARAGVGDLVYFDPPYLPVSPSASFAAYNGSGFGVGDHERLADVTAACVKRGANVLLSNSDTAESRRIFTRNGWHVETVKARRNINSDGDGRGKVGELLVSAPKRRR